MSAKAAKINIDRKVCRVNQGKLLTMSLSFLLTLSGRGAAAQDQAVAVQKAPAPAVSVGEPIDASPAPTADDAGLAASGTVLNPLRNVELLDRLDDDRLPTRPRRFLKQRFIQVRQAKDEKILQLLLICVGFVGVFVAILALRSVPPSRAGT